MLYWEKQNIVNGQYDVKDFLKLMEKKEELEKKTGVKKFDICLMNPPYDKNLYIKFMEKTFDLINDDGSLIYIGPDNWLIDKYPFMQKSKIKNNTRDKYCKYIDDIETFTGSEFNKLFGTNNFFGVSIFKMKHNAKGIDPQIYEDDNKLNIKILKKIQEFSSLRSHFCNREKNDCDTYVPVRRTNHKYLNWVERDKSKIKSIDGILFKTKNEVENFIKSFDTWLYKYLNCTDWGGSENSADVPYLNDYTHEWTNEKLYELFNITSEERKIIEQTLKEKSKW